MSEDAILERLERIETYMMTAARVRGDRLTRAEMCERLRISGKTLTDRVRRGVAPSPCSDGKWLLSEILEWESREASRKI